MEQIKLTLDDKGNGAFQVMDGEQQLAEMVLSVSGNHLTVFHTEVSPEQEGKGLAKKLLDAMVDYARKHALKVIPLCPFVHAQFKRHPEEFRDVWLKELRSQDE